MSFSIPYELAHTTSVTMGQDNLRAAALSYVRSILLSSFFCFLAWAAQGCVAKTERVALLEQTPVAANPYSMQVTFGPS